MKDDNNRDPQYMGDMIPISYETGKPSVRGRDLHRALRIDTPYKDWFPRMLKYGFRDEIDFSAFLRESTGGRPSVDHSITIAMAKELCMLQRSEMGRAFRQYFISIEEAWNSPEKIMERALQIAQENARKAEQRIWALADENEVLEIALNTSLQFYTVAKYNKVFAKNWNLRQCQNIGKHLSAYCRSHAIEIRPCKTNDERFGTVNSYPLTAWEDYQETLCEI